MNPFLPFGLTFLYRVIIPGFVSSLTLLPLIIPIWSYMGTTNIHLLKFIHSNFDFDLLVFPFISILFGITFDFLRTPIYKLFEGIRLWPKFLRDCRINALNNKILSKKKRLSSSSIDPIERRKIVAWLRMFPRKSATQEQVIQDDKLAYEAIHPTVLGNIIYSYERYPESRYGIKGILFWHRLWLMLDDNIKKEINISWSKACSSIYLSFAFSIYFFIYMILFLLHLFNLPSVILDIDNEILVRIPPPHVFIILSILSAFLSFVFYRLSFPIHMEFGDSFKSAFDVYRHRLYKIGLPINLQDETKHWERIWNYLLNLRVYCEGCNKYFNLQNIESHICRPIEHEADSPQEESANHTRGESKEVSDGLRPSGPADI